MINIILIITISLILILSNYIAFGYGLKIGKAIKEIPESPVEEIKKSGKKAVRLVKDLKTRTYIPKYSEKERGGVFD